MKLYYTSGACSLADHIALGWIGEPYDTVRVSKEERRSPDYLKINPNGAVPTFEHDGWVLTQNAAILNYLADLFVLVRWAKAQNLDLSGLDNLERFFQTMLADPGVQKALKDEGLT